MNKLVFKLTLYWFLIYSFIFWLSWVFRHLNWNTDNCLLFFFSSSHAVKSHDDDASTWWKVYRVLVWICSLQVIVAILHKYIHIRFGLFFECIILRSLEQIFLNRGIKLFICDEVHGSASCLWKLNLCLYLAIESRRLFSVDIERG